MKRFRWFDHPVLIFILSVVALAVSLFLYIYWYIEVSAGLVAVAERYHLDPGQFLEVKTWVVILVLSILVGIILLGIFVIFVYNQKTWQLYRLQQNFLGNFTHELKTPLASLKLYLDTFAKYELPREDQLKYIRFMSKDVERLLDKVNLILNLARIESKTYKKEFIWADLGEAIEQFHKQNADLFRDCEINVHKPPDQAYPYRINPSLFDMLLMNILINAVKYNDSDRPRIDIRFIPVKKGLSIRFEDNGVGIEKAEIGKVFRKFYQADRSSKISARGTGLGLYLVKQIAKIHRGTVSAESGGAGKGSVISLTLPLQIRKER